MRFEHAHAEALRESGGKIRPAAAHLARKMELDDELRGQVATALVAFLFEPGRTVHAQAFAEAAGSSVEEFVRQHAPNPDECRDPVEIY